MRDSLAVTSPARAGFAFERSPAFPRGQAQPVGETRSPEAAASGVAVGTARPGTAGIVREDPAALLAGSYG
jgi:hypothetical protein